MRKWVKVCSHYHQCGEIKVVLGGSLIKGGDAEPGMWYVFRRGEKVGCRATLKAAKQYAEAKFPETKPD